MQLTVQRIHSIHMARNHVAGIAAALTNNVAGIAGIAWKNTMLPVKVLDEKRRLVF